jgi:phosphohistidine phosphatase
MNLYLVRHGIAVPHLAAGVPEDERPLTDEGIRKLNLSARGLRSLDCSPKMILTSPLIRARQTAEILAVALDARIPLEICAPLAPSGRRERVYEEIRRRVDCQSLMLVGHQPSLGEIAAEIAWGTPQNYIEIKKGGACALELEITRGIPRGRILWLLTPSVLSSIHR